MARRGLKICCGITAIMIITIIVVTLILVFTVFKPKHPKITALPINLLNFSLETPNLQLNFSLLLTLNIHNPNYGSFTYKNSVSNITYNGTLAAEAYVDGGTFPARATRNISSTVNVQADKVMANPKFLTDLLAGSFNLSSSSELHGKVTVFKIFKLKAKTYNNCEVTIFVLNQTANSTCISGVKL